MTDGDLYLRRLAQRVYERGRRRPGGAHQVLMRRDALLGVEIDEALPDHDNTTWRQR